MSRSQKLLLQFYPDTVLTRLGLQYGFTSEDTQIRHLLGKALSALHRNGGGQEARETAKTNRVQLRKALDQLERLETSLHKIEDLDGFIYIDKVLERYEPTAKIQTDNPMAVLRNEEEVLDISLSVFRGVLQSKLENLNNKGGRPRNKGLQGFTEYMWMLWTIKLGRPFTLDYHKGSGTSPAFQFVKDMIAPAYEATETEIISAMRYVIATSASHES
ncbi:MAG: hypothetical protein V7727_14110 [Sneathiella sp.]